MTIITISRGTFSGGESLAECAAEKLGYRCISREFLVMAARQYDVPLESLHKALADPPGILERLSSERAHYLACVRAALVREVRNDNVIYHGLAGHFLLEGIPHLIRIRLIASMEFRIKGAMERRNLSREKAVEFIRQIDEKRTRWTKFLYHVDWYDPSLYDLIINIDELDISDACEIISSTASLDRFKTTPEKQKIVDDLVLSTEARALVATSKHIDDSGLEVWADEGIITLGGTVGSLQDADKIREIVAKVPGVKSIDSKMQVKST